MAALIAALRSRAADLGQAALAFAFPQRCPGCGSAASADRVLCDFCFAAIPPLATPLCARCLRRGRDPSGCRRHPRHETWAAHVFDERAARVVHAFKYEGRVGLATLLAAAIVRALPTALRPDLVTGASLHPARRRERGFDQAARLAAAVAERLGAPYLPDALCRVRATRPQVGLSERERRSNLENAFRVTHPAALAGRRVLVLDDVLTTGATLAACLDALEDAGAHGVAAAFAWAQ